MSDPRTLAVYRREAPGYTLSGTRGPSPLLRRFLDRLQPGARILDLGCGTGLDAAAMLARGFDVETWDGCAAMACKARERTGLPVRVATFDALNATETYDAIWAHASLIHERLETLPRTLACIFRALRPGGWHFASYMLGTGSVRDRIGRYYNCPSWAELTELYACTGAWMPVEVERRREPTADEGSELWAAVTARKAIRSSCGTHS